MPIRKDSQRVNRRQVLLFGGGAAATALLGAASGALSASCKTTGAAPVPRPTNPADLFGSPTGNVELHSWFDLPADDPRSRELSGIAWDAQANVLWGVQDEAASVVSLSPDLDFRTWVLGPTIHIDVGAPIDLEGVVVIPDGFIVSSEDGPRIIEVDRKGIYRRDIPVPPRFRAARSNKSLESLTASPSGRYLFTTTEVALERDGMPATLDAGTRVRIVRMERQNLKEVSEHVYLTDPLPYEGGDWGVADLAAVSDDTLLVLERGWSKGYGNTARVYQTSLDDMRAACMDMPEIRTSTPVLDKKLRVDIGKLASKDVPLPKQPQANPLLDNYEGLAIGPRLKDGRASLILVSDDNAHANQVARILVLAL